MQGRPGPIASSLLLTGLVLPGAAAQEPDARWPAEARLREVVAFLADDAMAGRGTPSPQLERAADRIAGWFDAAGLEPPTPDGPFHRYTVPGTVLDSRLVRLSLHPAAGANGPVVLSGGRDVRLWQAGPAVQREAAAARVVRLDGTLPPARLRAPFARMPVLVEVRPEDPLWQAAGERRRVLGPPRAGGMPVLLVRAGRLPAGELEVSLEVPEPGRRDVSLRNVVGVLPGAERPGEIVLVCSHYDHLGPGPAVGGDGIYNGASDATGVAAVVLLAEALAAGPAPERTVVFVCFSGKEKGLRGSRAFVASPPFPLDEVVAVLDIGRIGRTPASGLRELWIAGAEFSDLSALVAPALAAENVELVSPQPGVPEFFAGDNLPFAAAGVVAHAVGSGPVPADHHRPGDELEDLDPAHTAAVLRGLRAVVHSLAETDSVPSWNERGRRALERLR